MVYIYLHIYTYISSLYGRFTTRLITASLYLSVSGPQKKKTTPPLVFRLSKTNGPCGARLLSGSRSLLRAAIECRAYRTHKTYNCMHIFTTTAVARYLVLSTTAPRNSRESTSEISEKFTVTNSVRGNIVLFTGFGPGSGIGFRVRKIAPLYVVLCTRGIGSCFESTVKQMNNDDYVSWFVPTAIT